jgi:glycosyltransferase involved in cell wall biosynthesis
MAERTNALAVLQMLLRERLQKPREFPRYLRFVFRAVVEGGPRAVTNHWRAASVRREQRPPGDASSYASWIQAYDTIGPDDLGHVQTMAGLLPHQPRISVVMPVYNSPEAYLRRAIESVQAQRYENWELCIADDASTCPHVRRVLEQYARIDERVKVCFRTDNGHISAASNSALALATGDYIALMDHDDEIPAHALFVVADAINRHPHADLIYSDEDKIDADGRRYDPYFKSDWNEGLFLSHNMISHLGVYRTALVRAVGGFREGYEGSQDYDLALRCVEQTTGDRIVHLPFVLYHWRAIPGSTAHAPEEKSYAYTAALRALNDHFLRRGYRGEVVHTQSRGLYRARFAVPEPAPLVSILIPTRDSHHILSACVNSLLNKTTYPRYEILIVDNQSSDPETLSYLETLTRDPRVRVLRYDLPFNYSAINNFAVRQARGEVICLLNNDIEVITPDWLGEMVAHAMRPDIGAVGAKLLYPDDTVQHGGVVLGLGGIAGHAFHRLPRSAPGFAGRAIIGQELSAVTAACMVMRRDVYELAGGFEEGHLKVAFNDVDFCLRVKRLGYRIYWTPHALLYHHESKSRGIDDTPEKRARFASEVAYMRANWAEWLDDDAAYSPNLTLDTGDFALAFPPRVSKPWITAAVEAPHS